MKILGIGMMVLGFGGALLNTPMLMTVSGLDVSVLKCVFLVMYLAFVLVGGVGALLYQTQTFRPPAKKIESTPEPEKRKTCKVYSPGT